MEPHLCGLPPQNPWEKLQIPGGSSFLKTLDQHFSNCQGPQKWGKSGGT